MKNKFIRHTSCHLCRSSDARALYEGGGWFCWSCGKAGGTSTSPYLLDFERNSEEEIVLPYDSSFNYSTDCLNWVSKYGVTINELIQHKVYWSEEKKQLIFTFWDDGRLLMWQARNFGAWAKAKYYTKGKPDDLLPIYHSLNQSGLVLVEDCISAIKISRQRHAMPVLSSDLSLSKLKRLAGVLEASGGIVVWLDGNMYNKAQRMASRLQMLGVPARAVYTELDPKEYSDTEIKITLDKS